MQPISANGSQIKPQTPTNEINSKQNKDKKVLSTDIDSSLASLADNLDINYKNKGLSYVTLQLRIAFGFETFKGKNLFPEKIISGRPINSRIISRPVVMTGSR